MDYYEELGLSRAASADEIRQAYRQFVRLIHPDQQPDETLRRLADTQMKRLNMILEVLGDPTRRREYDLSLSARAIVRVPQMPPLDDQDRVPAWLRGVPRGAWVWLLAALVGIGTLGLFFAHYSGGGPVMAERPVIHASPVPVPQHPFAPIPTSSALPRLPHSKALPAVPPSFPGPAGSELPPEPDIPAEASVSAPNLPASSVDKPRPPSAGEPGFAGEWIYAPSPEEPKTDGLYAPEFIEVKIAEKHGQLWGAYRARYFVTDRAISPGVTFHFEGVAALPVSTLQWNGSGGAYGRVTLKLVSADSLEVSWAANKLSAELSLISGVATLTRRRAP